MDISKIYELAPQMRTYNQLGFDWKPFIMNIQSAKFRSKVVNTDNFGLRFNGQRITNSIFETKNHFEKKTGTIIGSSSAFGIGSSNDNYTIPSLLSENTDFELFSS